jgi:4-alpha-glucanotransferase
VAAFGRERSREVTFHIFAQWVADHSLSVAQGRAREAGMAVGLIADLAVGTDPGGSHAWSRRADILSGLNIGAPPDLLQKHGQDWGVAAFSPRALRSSGYQPFLATLRAGLRHAGGLRIDHVMGLLRLWMVPHGDSAADGAYLRYPVGDLLGLIALESSRAGALIVGEDLGTVPEGFREALAGKGLMGMSVLWFERDEETFSSPGTWSKAAMAMTSTHDLPTIAGWWSERDIDWQARRGAVDEVAACASPAPQTQSCDGAPPASDAALDVASDRKARALDRHRLWRAFCEAGVAAGPAPPPTDTGPVVDAAAGFIAQSPSPLALAPIEDLLGLTEQINLPGDISLHPNWRRRLPASADHLFETASLKARTARLNDRRG